MPSGATVIRIDRLARIAQNLWACAGTKTLLRLVSVAARCCPRSRAHAETRLMRNRQCRLDAGLVVLAIVVRAAAVLILQSHQVPRSSYEHGEIAANLLAGHGFQDLLHRRRLIPFCKAVVANVCRSTCGLTSFRRGRHEYTDFAESQNGNGWSDGGRGALRTLHKQATTAFISFRCVCSFVQKSVVLKSRKTRTQEMRGARIVIHPNIVRH